MTFADFGLDAKILAALDSMGFEKPSPVQEQAIPLILEGHDLIALAETGSGKTAACAIPVCQKANIKSRVVQTLIVVPTRELALQYAVETQRVGQKRGVKVYALYGGDSPSVQMAKLRAGVQVLVATPGRLIDLIHRRAIDLSQVKTLILDEADEMLSMGFYDDLEFIMTCLVQKHQTLLFSATMPKDISKIARKHMHEPKELILQSKVTTPKLIDHRFIFVDSPVMRPNVLIDLLNEYEPNQSLIFCGSRRQTEEVCRHLKAKRSQVDYLHGGLSQPLRSTITGKFRSGKIRTLVATDVAARGLDFSGVTHVFIYQLGKEIDTYLHRSGRTGRSGREGVAITLITRYEFDLLDRVLKRIDREPNWIGPPPPKGVRGGNGGKRPKRPSSGRRPRRQGSRR